MSVRSIMILVWGTFCPFWGRWEPWRDPTHQNQRRRWWWESWETWTSQNWWVCFVPIFSLEELSWHDYRYWLILNTYYNNYISLNVTVRTEMTTELNKSSSQKVFYLISSTECIFYPEIRVITLWHVFCLYLCRWTRTSRCSWVWSTICFLVSVRFSHTVIISCRPSTDECETSESIQSSFCVFIFLQTQSVF